MDTSELSRTEFYFVSSRLLVAGFEPEITLEVCTENALWWHSSQLIKCRDKSGPSQLSRESFHRVHQIEQFPSSCLVVKGVEGGSGLAAACSSCP